MWVRLEVPPLRMSSDKLNRGERLVDTGCPGGKRKATEEEKKKRMARTQDAGGGQASRCHHFVVPVLLTSSILDTPSRWHHSEKEHGSILHMLFWARWLLFLPGDYGSFLPPHLSWLQEVCLCVDILLFHLVNSKEVRAWLLKVFILTANNNTWMGPLWSFQWSGHLSIITNATLILLMYRSISWASSRFILSDPVLSDMGITVRQSQRT